MSRWRDVKQNRIIQKPADALKSVSVAKRLKAFIIDMFMINMPILYITAYLILDGREDFQSNPLAIFACTLLFGLILSIFLSQKAQTPGYKAYGIKLVNIEDGKTPNFTKSFLRFVCFSLVGVTLFLLLLPFFRDDKRSLHDILTRTIVVSV